MRHDWSFASLDADSDRSSRRKSDNPLSSNTARAEHERRHHLSIHHSSRRSFLLRAAALFSVPICCCNPCRIPSSFTILRLSFAAPFRKGKSCGSPNLYSRCNCRKIWPLAEPIRLMPVHLRGTSSKSNAAWDRHPPCEHIQAKAKICSMETPCKIVPNLFRFCLARLGTARPPPYFPRVLTGRLADDHFVFTAPMRSLQLPIPPSLPRQISTAIFGMRHD